MELTAKILLVILALASAILYQKYSDISKNFPKPKLNIDEYWGPGDKASYKENKAIAGYKINYSTEVINDLRQRLSRPLKLHDPLEGIGFEYGFNSKKLQQVIKYWRDDYLPRWREREDFLKKFPHFTTQVQGLRIHYIHTTHEGDQAKGKKVYPLLLLHGWPGSVREFYDIIPKLTFPSDDSDYVFEVVAPSLPGYGWSQGASKTGFGPAEMAVVLRNLMLRLGHKKFFIQGGDWGSLIGMNIATLFPENVLGYHSNMCVANSPLSNIKLFIASLYPSWFVEKDHEEFFFPLGDKFTSIIEETGYMHIQATKPDTIGSVLTDNPVGLAAYILEKFSTWTNPKYKLLADGGLDKDFALDALLDNVMIYYLTNSITTSQRLYSEALSNKQRALNMDRVPTEVPTGCSRFKYDLAHSMDWQLENKFPNLIQSTFHQNGGHFAAMQVPNILYKDFIEFVKKTVEKKKVSK